MPQISLIIPLYNAEKYLVPCLESVARQSFRDFEVLCINDGSQDGLSTRKTPVVRQPAITA